MTGWNVLEHVCWFFEVSNEVDPDPMWDLMGRFPHFRRLAWQTGRSARRRVRRVALGHMQPALDPQSLGSTERRHEFDLAMINASKDHFSRFEEHLLTAPIKESPPI